MKNLVIVESPAKAKTIKKYLGKGFEVLASYGHVRDLVPKEGAVDPQNQFAMRYEVIERNHKYVKAIESAFVECENLYLATDPDREGEAIAWHLWQILQPLRKKQAVHRVVFHEITQKAVTDAIQKPRQIADSLVNAQQARRALDYLVGFNLSPLLWRKVSPGLSAGRVQSPALRLISEREAEIEVFEPREYWHIELHLQKNKQHFVGKLHEFDGERVAQFSFTDAMGAEQAREVLLAALQKQNNHAIVRDIDKKQRRRHPSPPFTTSTLQQEANRKLGFSASRTMKTAQQLYEGINIGGQTVGLITYMRTDSVHLADEAVDGIRQFILHKFGQPALFPTVRTFKTKSKNAQEAHEAIRPTDITLQPDGLKEVLSPDQYKLYKLIWKRTVACQMMPALYDTVSVLLGAGNHVFKSNGSTLLDAGFLAVYQEGQDDLDNNNINNNENEPDEKTLPLLNLDEKVAVVLPSEDALTSNQHFTEAPPRYTEASLVKTLEEYDIGRPSTYASIIATLLGRDYVVIDNKRFSPTDTGRIVNQFLTQHFGQYVDYEFTAHLEDTLDSVARGEREWIPVLEDFWQPFHTQVEEKQSLTREEVAQTRQLGFDPETNKPVSVRVGKYGAFVQIGDKDDTDKPRWASLRAEQRMTTITLEQALALFELPKVLGENKDGEKIKVAIGRFGPYVQYGKASFASLKAEDDPYTITLARALELIEAKQIADANKYILRFEGSEICVLNGRWGAYITDGKKNAKIPKGTEPTGLTLARCVELLAAAPEKPKKSFGKKK